MLSRFCQSLPHIVSDSLNCVTKQCDDIVNSVNSNNIANSVNINNSANSVSSVKIVLKVVVNIVKIVVKIVKFVIS